MAARGKVVVSLSPAEAEQITEYLKGMPIPLMGVPLSNAPALPNGVRVEVVGRFTKISTRKRAGWRTERVEVEIDRDDAGWFAAKIRVGMFGGGSLKLLPPHIRDFCFRCAVSITKSPGRPAYKGRDLELALARQAKSIERGDVDIRHLKRLRSHARADQRLQAEIAHWRGLLASRENLP